MATRTESKLDGLRPCIFPSLNDDIDCRAELGRENVTLDLGKIKLPLQSLDQSRFQASIELALCLLLREYVDADDVIYAFVDGGALNVYDERRTSNHKHKEHLVKHLNLHKNLNLGDALDAARYSNKTVLNATLAGEGSDNDYNAPEFNTAVIVHDAAHSKTSVPAGKAVDSRQYLNEVS